jgi:hypothetical protein
MQNLGKLAYEAYCNSVNWKSVTGMDLPTWDQQSVRLQIAWDAAAEAVVGYLFDQNREATRDVSE